MTHFPSSLQPEYYTDDSLNLLKRKVFTDQEAMELGIDFGDDKSMNGVNGYPCNKGLVIKLRG